MFDGSAIDVNNEHLVKTLRPRIVMFDGSVIDANDESLNT